MVEDLLVNSGLNFFEQLEILIPIFAMYDGIPES